MSGLSKLSLERLSTCHQSLQTLVMEVAKDFPCFVIEGHRNEKDQNQAFNSGASKLPWPKGNHNANPSRAVDLAPEPYEPKNVGKLQYFAGFVMATAIRLGINIRWGGDWNRNLNPSDESFKDLFHFELR